MKRLIVFFTLLSFIPSLLVPTVQPPPTDSVRPRSAAAKGSSMERQRTGRVTYTPYTVPIRDVGLTEVQRYAVWDSRLAPCYSHDPNIQRHDGRYIYGVGDSSTPDSATAPPDNNVQQTLEKAPTDDMFGRMTPCWRLLERAKLYMEKVIIALGTFKRIKKLSL